MKQHLKNTANITFYLCFFALLFFIIRNNDSVAASNSLRVKSHPNFNKKFSGLAFILDGDSMKVGGKEVRLYMLDAPEYSQTCFNAKDEEYECGQKSRDFLINLAGGKEVECVYAMKDKYDRFLSKCYVDDKSINEELVQNGMAVIYSFGDSDEKMEKYEAEAKKKKIGIWQGKFQLPKDYRKQHKRN